LHQGSDKERLHLHGRLVLLIRAFEVEAFRRREQSPARAVFACWGGKREPPAEILTLSLPKGKDLSQTKPGPSDTQHKNL
jgi:hypothetical protein